MRGIEIPILDLLGTGAVERRRGVKGGPVSARGVLGHTEEHLESAAT
ncbi:hypothetical protein Vwe01_29990 [Micromonospora andamanensis]|nr:hypothetical protein Vwe01_29990 [Micromonospora andamanensis]